MIAFVIKSTFCMAVLLGFYRLFLSNIRLHQFNRFFLLFSFVFSLIIPFITIPITINNLAYQAVPAISHKAGILLTEQLSTERTHGFLTLPMILCIMYGIISLVFFLKFITNIYKLIREIRMNSHVRFDKSHLILIEKLTLPYSFFRYIFVPRTEYYNRTIQQEILIHEQTHCIQYHSADILLIELIKIILWFNPFVWFFRKEIQLNHEYLADNHVLMHFDLKDYQNILLNLVFRNNSTYLASNLNYSLTKKRFMMMTKHDHSGKTLYRKVGAISLFLMLAISLTFSQTNTRQRSAMTPAKADSLKTVELQQKLADEQVALENKQKTEEQKAICEEQKALVEEQKALVEEQKAAMEDQKAAIGEQKSQIEEEKAQVEEEKAQIAERKMEFQKKSADEKKALDEAKAKADKK